MASELKNIINLNMDEKGLDAPDRIASKSTKDGELNHWPQRPEHLFDRVSE